MANEGPADARHRRPRWARWGIDLAVLGVLVLGLGAWQTRGHLAGGEMPAAVLATLDGERVALDREPGAGSCLRAGSWRRLPGVAGG